MPQIAAGNESKTEYLDSFWKGGEGFNGLDSDLQTVSSSVRRADVTSLSVPGLKYSFDHDGTDVKYSIRISKFGPYIASDYFDKESGKDRMASIDQNRYFPGTFQDGDAKVILFPDSGDVAIAEGITVATGRYGQYLKAAQTLAHCAALYEALQLSDSPYAAAARKNLDICASALNPAAPETTLAGGCSPCHL